MGGEITMYVTIAVSLVFGVLYVVCILMFFGQAGIMVAGYNFEPTAPEAKKLHKKIMRRFGLGIFVVCLFVHGTIVAFLYAGNVAGGVLAGVSAAVLVAVLVAVNTGKMKEWTEEERRLDEEHRRALSEREGEQGE